MLGMNALLARTNMIEQQIKPVDVLDPKILKAFDLPRDLFVPVTYKNVAYADSNIPIGNDRVLLAPNIIGRLLQSLALKPNQEVLEIQTGCGYLTGMLAQLCQHVTSFETNKSLAIQANKKLASLGLNNYEILNADGRDGLDNNVIKGSEFFDVVVLTESVPSIPKIYGQQLKIGGKLFAVVGQAPVMHACIFTKISKEGWSSEKLFETMIPPAKETTEVTTFEF